MHILVCIFCMADLLSGDAISSWKTSFAVRVCQTVLNNERILCDEAGDKQMG